MEIYQVYNNKVKKEEVSHRNPQDNFKEYEILCYHRIIDNDCPNYLYPDDGLSVSLRNFKKQLNYNKRNFNLIDLKKNDITCENNFKIKVLITFDDGYKDIITLVLPLIEKLNVPIVVFISTGLIENHNEFCWWIDLWHGLISKSIISLNFNNEKKTFPLESFSHKMKCYKYVSRILIDMKRESQIAFFEENNLDINNIKDFLSAEDVKILSSHPLVTLGYHSNYHLNYLSLIHI